MYFAIDLDKKQIQSDAGDIFTANQFKGILEQQFKNNTIPDMTLMTQRFIRLGFDWDRLEAFYNEND